MYLSNMKVTGTRYINIKPTQSKVKTLSEVLNPKSFFHDNIAIVHLGDIFTLEDKRKNEVVLCKSQKRSKKSATRCYKKKCAPDNSQGEHKICQDLSDYQIKDTMPVIDDLSVTEL
jgi:hypothetical protein